MIINTHCSWLHGDTRGFRSRYRRIVSSGDYKHRPPAGEHAGLYHYRDEQSGNEVHIAKELRSVVGSAIRQHLSNLGFRVLVIAVTKVHAHFLVQLPDDIRRIKAIVGEAKRMSSRAVKFQLPGTVWARAGNYKPVRSRSHLLSAFNYILYDQGAGAWTWSFLDKSDAGRFGRVRVKR